MNFVRKSLNSLVKLQQMFRIAEIELGMENTIGITLETGVGVQSAILHVCPVVFLSCPLVKKHADLSGSFLYSQSTRKDMYSKPINRRRKAVRSHSLYIYKPKNVREKETTRKFLNS